jgi:hypothetical protein
VDSAFDHTRLFGDFDEGKECNPYRADVWACSQNGALSPRMLVVFVITAPAVVKISASLKL